MGALGLLMAGVVIGTAASFSGLGGGFLMVPLLLWLGYSAQRAVGTSFVAILLIAVSAVLAHGRLQNVDWRVGLWLAAGGVVGAQLGARIVERVDTGLFAKIFAVALAALAAKMLFQR